MLELPSRTYEFASSLSFFWRRNCNGIRVAGLAVLGLTTFYIFSIFYEWRLDFNRRYDHCFRDISFSLAESIALFARVGGGIIQKPMLC
jgi:Na+/H+-translocating membrane pyrophosphatase